MFFAKYDKNGDGTSLDNTDEIFEDMAKGDLDKLDESDDDKEFAGEKQGGQSQGKPVTIKELYE